MRVIKRVLATFSLRARVPSTSSSIWRSFSGSRCERAASLAGRRLRLVALAQYHIGAHQPQPSLEIGAVLLQPLGQPLDHAAHHGGALFGAEVVGGGHVLLVGPVCVRAALDPRQLAADELGPGRVAGAPRQHGAPDRGGVRGTAILLGGQRRGNSAP